MAVRTLNGVDIEVLRKVTEAYDAHLAGRRFLVCWEGENGPCGMPVKVEGRHVVQALGVKPSSKVGSATRLFGRVASRAAIEGEALSSCSKPEFVRAAHVFWRLADITRQAKYIWDCGEFTCLAADEPGQVEGLAFRLDDDAFVPSHVMVGSRRRLVEAGAVTFPVVAVLERVGNGPVAPSYPNGHPGADAEREILGLAGGWGFVEGGRDGQSDEI